MALIKCKECSKEVSNKAENCPHCGARVARKPLGCGTLLALIAFVLIMSSVWESITGDKSSFQKNVTSESAPVVKEQSEHELFNAGRGWYYLPSKDEMTGKTTYSATLKSINELNLSFPYQGAQRGILTLREHPRHGKDMIFNIDKGQIICGRVSDCYVEIKFDDQPIKKYPASFPSDNSSNILFIEGYQELIIKLKQAKTLKLNVTIYQEGQHTFTFNVAGFSDEKFISD